MRTASLLCRLLGECYGGQHQLGIKKRRSLYSDLNTNNSRKLLGLLRLWRPPEEKDVVQVTSSTEVSTETAAQEVVAAEVPVPRNVAIENIIQKLHQERVRINGTASACGVEAHKDGGIAPLPGDDSEAGNVIDMSPGPHGDQRTLCQLATLPTIMKVRCNKLVGHVPTFEALSQRC
jgi:hypothetical protein